MEKPDGMLTMLETQVLLGCSHQHLYDEIRRGRLARPTRTPAMGRRVLFSLADISAYLEAKRQRKSAA